MTSPAARRRISDHAAGLAVLSMVSSFGVGDIVGGIIAGSVSCRTQLVRACRSRRGIATPDDVREEQTMTELTAHAAEARLRQGTYVAGVIEGHVTERTGRH